MGLAQRIYDGEKITYDPKLLQATVKPYLDGIAKGYGKTLADVDWNTPDAKTLQKLTENVFQFSASKDFHILSDMTAALKGSDGKMRSFDDFRAEVDKMNVKYNQNWLRTEYNQAVASSQCAARWTDFEKHSKSMPFLQYQAVMDGNTRAEHAALNGVIKRVDSDFWDKYYPPNGWGCRCEVIQLPGKNHKETPNTAIDLDRCKVSSMWKVNVGKKGVVFPKGHPYFINQCATNGCPLKGRKLADGTLKEQCQGCLQGMEQCKKEIGRCIKKPEWCNFKRMESYTATDNDIKLMKENGWKLPFKNAEEYNKSLMAGFDVLRFERNITTGIKFLETVKKVDVRHFAHHTKNVRITEDGVELDILVDGLYVKRVFKMEDGKLTVYHKQIRTYPENKNIAPIVNLEFIKQYISMGVKKITLKASSSGGGYAWARMGFYTTDKEKVKDIIAKMPSPLRERYQDIFDKNNKEDQPFPMASIANDETKQFLRWSEWNGFLDLENEEHIKGTLKYLQDKQNGYFP